MISLWVSDTQDYQYSYDPNGAVYTYRFRRGKWEGTRWNHETNRWVKQDNPSLIIGRRDHYFDFSF